MRRDGLEADCLLLYSGRDVQVWRSLIENEESEANEGALAALASLQDLKKPAYNRIAVTVDFSPSDRNAIKNALALGQTSAKYLLIHIVESAGALVMGKDIIDFETSVDKVNLELYAEELNAQGYSVRIELGYGNPKKRIPELVKDYQADLLVMGSHGHKMMKDLIYGETINTVRHSVDIPVLIVKP